jgi:hypothetical protein
MKKLLFILALGAFVACNDNNGGDDVDPTPETAPVQEAPAPEVVDSTTVAPADSTVAQ